MDGRKKPYTEEERSFFEQIDPLFFLEETYFPANPLLCPAGLSNTQKDAFFESIHKSCSFNSAGSIFLDANGDIYACNISKKKLGNIYSSKEPAVSAELSVHKDIKKCHRECSCFLAYKNRTDLIPELSLFGHSPAFRILKKYAAAFFDIDNTLVLPDETEVSEKTARILKAMSRYCDIYLATSLPYPAAMKKCKTIRSILSGGIFAGGAHIRLSAHPDKTQYFFIKESLAKEISRHYEQCGFSVRIYRTTPGNASVSSVPLKSSCPDDSGIYKITMIPQNKKRTVTGQDITFSSNLVRSYIEQGHIQIIAAAASKRHGVKTICDIMNYPPDNILTCGDSVADRDMWLL